MKRESNFFKLVPGAHNRNRTGDLFLTKEVLYRLSYVGGKTNREQILLFDPKPLSSHPKLERVSGIEPPPSAWKAEVLPLNYTRLSIPTPVVVEGEGFEPSKA